MAIEIADFPIKNCDFPRWNPHLPTPPSHAEHFTLQLRGCSHRHTLVADLTGCSWVRPNGYITINDNKTGKLLNLKFHILIIMSIYFGSSEKNITNVVKTMPINHPRNHHFYRWYKPSKNGVVWLYSGNHQQKPAGSLPNAQAEWDSTANATTTENDDSPTLFSDKPKCLKGPKWKGAKKTKKHESKECHTH